LGYDHEKARLHNHCFGIALHETNFISQESIEHSSPNQTAHKEEMFSETDEGSV
jgi:hypothetical protein